jgi:hypothetical protein
MVVRVEQMNFSELLQDPGGEEQPETSQPTIKTKKPKKNMELISKFKVNVNGITIPGVIDYIRPSEKDNFWTFYTSDSRVIETSGNVIVEAI